MIIVHSLWSLPLLKNRWNIKEQFKKSYSLYKLSFMYAKRLGYKVILHTDDQGYNLLKDIGYDRVELSLNDLPQENIKFWALGKIRAIEIEGINSIHIDGDVFLKSKNIINIFNSDYDVLTQMTESKESFKKNYLLQLKIVNTVSELLKSDIDYSYNCGILCFKDLELLKEYIDYIEQLVELYKNNSVINSFYKKAANYYERMLIIEQYALPIVVQRLDRKIKFIINKGDDIKEICNYFGFVHAMGKSKYESYFQNKVKKRINELEE